jgi:hypothetical protein
MFYLGHDLGPSQGEQRHPLVLLATHFLDMAADRRNTAQSIPPRDVKDKKEQEQEVAQKAAWANRSQDSSSGAGTSRSVGDIMMTVDEAI